MTWRDLLFMHWPVPVAALRPHVPTGLEIETFGRGAAGGRSEGETAWLGIVPFRMTGVRHRLLPALPWLASFPELNVRTYVRLAIPAGQGKAKPGVWFFSLEAANALAVAVARAVFRLPYMNARMRVQTEDGWVRYESVRTRRGAPPAEFRGRYRAVEEAFRAAPGSLERFLTERYCLYAADRRGRLLRGEIHHAPWPLRRAEAEVERNTMASPLGLDLADIERRSGPPLLHFAERLDVVAWWPES